ncbi:hypothetical protein [Caballeronia sp. RCC_10]|uniref:hypothetical protein n=1 Tax=Caballeronia sp. RCC_10 TaxID=3239227 RepID=UPI0035235454
MLSKDAHAYTFDELVYATLGRMDRVKRNEHKGFDYAALVRQMRKYFDIVEVSGHPFGFLPARLCFSIGIIAKPKQASTSADMKASGAT